MGWDGRSWTRNFHELRVRDLALFALGDVKGKKVLEVGCGTGIYLDILARMGGQISGQDISSEYVKDALAYLKENKLEADIKLGDAVKLLFNDNYFDALLIMARILPNYIYSLFTKAKIYNWFPSLDFIGYFFC